MSRLVPAFLRRRPLGVSIVAILGLLGAILSLIRVGQAAVNGASGWVAWLWPLGVIALAVGLWQAQRWSWWGTTIAAALEVHFTLARIAVSLWNAFFAESKVGWEAVAPAVFPRLVWAVMLGWFVVYFTTSPVRRHFGLLLRFKRELLLRIGVTAGGLALLLLILRSV